MFPSQQMNIDPCFQALDRFLGDNNLTAESLHRADNRAAAHQVRVMLQETARQANITENGLDWNHEAADNSYYRDMLDGTLLEYDKVFNDSFEAMDTMTQRTFVVAAARKLGTFGATLSDDYIFERLLSLNAMRLQFIQVSRSLNKIKENGSNGNGNGKSKKNGSIPGPVATQPVPGMSVPTMSTATQPQAQPQVQPQAQPQVQPQAQPQVQPQAQPYLSAQQAAAATQNALLGLQQN